jgi:hypothetical protein
MWTRQQECPPKIRVPAMAPSHDVGVHRLHTLISGPSAGLPTLHDSRLTFLNGGACVHQLVLAPQGIA